MHTVFNRQGQRVQTSMVNIPPIYAHCYTQRRVSMNFLYIPFITISVLIYTDIYNIYFLQRRVSPSLVKQYMYDCPCLIDAS